MPPKKPCGSCTLKDEILARLDGLNSTIDAKLTGIQSEIGGGFQSIRVNIDKVERTQIKQWERLIEYGEKVGINSQKLSGFKWVVGILITLQLSTFGSVIWIALRK